MAMTAMEFRALRKKGDILTGPACVRCGQPLRESVTGCRYTTDGYVDSDCYYRELGEIVEKFPIGTARIRRG